MAVIQPLGLSIMFAKISKDHSQTWQ